MLETFLLSDIQAFLQHLIENIFPQAQKEILLPNSFRNMIEVYEEILKHFIPQKQRPELPSPLLLIGIVLQRGRYQGSADATNADYLS